MAWWIAPAVFAVSGIALLLAALISSGGASTSLYIVIPIVITLSLSSIFMELSLRRRVAHGTQRVQDEEGGTITVGTTTITDETKRTNLLAALDVKLRPSTITITMVMTPSISLFWILFLRLAVGEDHFQGDAPMLDFGPLNGVEGGERNIAFDGGGDTDALFHALQGEFAAFLAFPAVARILAALLGGRGRKTIIYLAELLSAAFSLFPCYLILEYFWDFDESFATSRYISEALEWSMGYCVGMSAGFFVTALVEIKLLGDVDPDSPADEDIQVDKLVEKKGHRFIRLLHILFGIFMICTVLTYGGLFGFGWNRCADDVTDCVNYASNGSYEVLVGLLFSFVPVIMVAAIALREKCRS